MVEAKNPHVMVGDNKTRQLGRNRGIPKTQLGFGLDQYLKHSWVLASTKILKHFRKKNIFNIEYYSVLMINNHQTFPSKCECFHNISLYFLCFFVAIPVLQLALHCKYVICTSAPNQGDLNDF